MRGGLATTVTYPDDAWGVLTLGGRSVLELTDIHRRVGGGPNVVAQIRDGQGVRRLPGSAEFRERESDPVRGIDAGAVDSFPVS